METRSGRKRPKLVKNATSSTPKNKILPKILNLPIRNAFTTPPRNISTNNDTNSPITPKTPSKRTKRILNYSTENKTTAATTLTLPSSSTTSSSTFKNKLSSSKARRCLFPSNSDSNNKDSLISSYSQKNKQMVALKIEKWKFDFENDKPLEDSVSTSPIWKLEINPPKFYATRSRVTQEKLEKESEKSICSQTGSLIQEAIKDAVAIIQKDEEKAKTAKSSSTTKSNKRRASSSSSVTKTPQKQQKITDTFSPRKTPNSSSSSKKVNNSGNDKSSGFKKNLTKARRKLSHL